jgi:hypothetical protein
MRSAGIMDADAMERRGSVVKARMRAGREWIDKSFRSSELSAMMSGRGNLEKIDVRDACAELLAKTAK